jgi:FkbM family methyltransferase
MHNNIQEFKPLAFRLFRKLSRWSRQASQNFANLRREAMCKYREWRRPDYVKLRGVRMSARPDIWGTKDALRDALYYEYYEESELKMLSMKLDTNDRVMELGTGLGLISSYCAMKIGSDRVYTFEANPALESYIRQTYQLNAVNPRADFCVLGSEEGERTFYIGKNFYSSSTLRRNPEDMEIRVPVKSFNDEIRKINPTFLIIDIEGGEYELMHYANLQNVTKLLIELHEHVIGREKIDFVKTKLSNMGFAVELNMGNEMFFRRL